ncbi:asparagine synthase (glutamine-hydrolyzing) [Maribacter chungangensis]|uniref:asparagine synthase (glutamine-hydrolyzing) n=1 Tax=Maribacter chungangensis TaxID=1069117 RepID=A0ABW3B1Z7_9FLAO
MCGILGSVNQAFDVAMLNQIEHRGPDDFGIDSFMVNEHNVQFGQRRLSIIDLSPAGHQPMISPCKKYALIFNGEIYNHRELRKKLPEDITYNGHSDTETILHCLIHFGEAAVKEFNGIFAFTFLDLDNATLLMARDPFGVKPLYYFDDGKKLIFSSEIRPIKSLLNTKALNQDALASLLRLRYNAAPDTLYEQIKKILPGHIYRVEMGSAALRSTCTPFTPVLPKVVQAQPEKLIADYGVALEAAVKRQLLADVEVGILLSGGIDSALIAALAKKHYKGKLKAFTIGFEGDFDEDEISDAQETAELLGLDHYIKKISFSDFLGLIKECSRIVEEPLATTSMIPMYYLAELAAERVKVVLTGQGADEPLGGYTRYRSELIRDKIPSPLRGAFRPVAQLMGSKNEQVLRGAKAIGISDEIERFLSVYEIFSQEEIQKLITIKDVTSKTAIANFYEVLDCRSRKHSADKMMAIDTRMNLADDLLTYTDKITMNFSLECRVPMLDIALVQFMEGLPLHLKLNSRQGKIIHKEFAKTVLPDNIIHRKKKGFQSPTNKWFREEMHTVKDILLKNDSDFSSVFNQDYIAEILEQHNSGYNREKQIFLLLSIYYWFQSNNKK